MTRLRLLDNNGSVNKLQRKILVVKILNKIKSSFFDDSDLFFSFFFPNFETRFRSLNFNQVVDQQQLKILVVEMMTEIRSPFFNGPIYFFFYLSLFFCHYGIGFRLLDYK